MKSVWTSRETIALVEPDETYAWICVKDPNLPDVFTPYEDKWKHVLRLAFYDAPGAAGITDEDAKKIIKFLEELQELPNCIEHIICSCEMGVSRSAGICKFVLEYYDEEFPDGSYFSKDVYNKLREV